MDAERLKQIEEIYHAALDVSADGRKSFVENRCSGDERLRYEVESLLSFEDSADIFLDQSPASLAAEIFGEATREVDYSGQKIGHYKIVELLGRGAMGAVYLAEDTKLERLVALKILPPEFAEDESRMSRFVREAKSASALNHPNIITIYEIGEANGTHYIATEYIDGETLREYFKKRSLNLKSALEIVVQIISALNEAHSARIVHRDIKPDNVMIRANGLVKILDFGIAKLSESGRRDEGEKGRQGEGEKGKRGEEETERRKTNEATFASSLHHPFSLSPLHPFSLSPRLLSSSTNPGVIIGTASYMSPEQARGREIDARTDIFSFGILFYELLAGRLPFEGATATVIIEAILREKPRSLDAGVPEEVKKIIEKCLRKDQSERYQTAAELLNDLKNAARSLDSLDKSELPHRPQPAITSENEELRTRNLNADTADEAIKKPTGETFSGKSGVLKSAAFVLVILLLGALGVFSYRYFAPHNKQIESLAVMPFVNESGSADIDYLSDGMTETLIGSLSQVPNLNVKARSSVFRYKGKETDPQTIGRELNVQAILNSRISSRDDQIILSLELIDAGSENVIWSQQYIRRQNDLVSLQSQIARDVSEKLQSRISGAEAAKVVKTSTISPEAYQAYLKGRFYWNRRTTENIEKAIEQFKFAAAQDPNYALAFAELADCYAVLDDYASVPASETLPQAKDYADHAIALDGNLAEPHATLGIINGKSREWTEAEREYKLAVELNPNYATAYHWYSILLRDLGRFDDSLAMIKKAHELDPLSSIITLNISQVYQAQKNYDASIENTLKILELDPNYAGAYNNLGLAYIKTGRNAEAVANFEKAVELGKRSPVVLRNLGYAYGVAGRRSEALAIAAELEKRYAEKPSSAQFIAAVYAGLGEKDKVFEWLEKGFQNNEDLAGIRWSPQFESIYDDPRYKDLMRRMNLPE